MAASFATAPRQLDLDDLTRPLESVMAYERRCAVKLTPEERQALFGRWCALNPEAVSAMEAEALRCDAEYGFVSAKYLLHWLRQTRPWLAQVGVPYEDMQGRQHAYKVNNNDGAALARWLLSRHPSLRVELRRSELDGVVA